MERRNNQQSPILRFRWLAFILSSVWGLSSSSSIPSPKQKTHSTIPALSVDSESTRQLQKIVIKYPDETNLFEKEDAPLGAKQYYGMSFVCQDDYEGDMSETEVKVRYTVETDTDVADTLEYCDEIYTEIADVVASTVMMMASETLCETGNGGLPSDGGRRRILVETGVEGCILGVYGGASGNNDGKCTPTLEQSDSCNLYTDYFTVQHTRDCERQDVLEAATSIFEMHLPSEKFLTDVNKQLNDHPKCGAYVVTKIDYFDDNSGVAAASSAVVMQQGGLTAGGKFVIFLAVAAVLIVLLLGFAWRRHVKNRRRRFEDDLKSIKTEWSNKTGGDNSYLQPDFHDLALRHSKQNVHRCNSAFCTTCRPNLGLVHMVPVPRDQKNRKPVRAEAFDLCSGDIDDEAACVPQCRTIGNDFDEADYKDPLEQPSPNDDLNQTFESDMTLEEASPTVTDTSQQRQQNHVGNADKQRGGFTFVRIADPKPADPDKGQKSKEVIL